MFATADEAEAAFYAAFQAADLTAMMDVWAATGPVACVHPHGDRLTGQDAIAESWRHIFAPGPVMEIAPSSQVLVHDADFALHLVYESLLLKAPRPSRARMVTTNAYRRTADGWRMVLHHASPAPPPASPPGAPLH